MNLWSLTAQLIALAVILQSFESLFIPEWDWSIQAAEFPRVLHPLVRNSRLWLYLRLAAAIATLLHPHFAWAALMTFATWILALRWRGTFNGGSDAMTMILLLSLSVGLAHPAWIPAALAYIAIQTLLSYFAAGLAKLRSPQWRRGQALGLFMKRPARREDLFISWVVILFECLFPLVLFSPALSLVFMGIGVVFHLAIARLLGLNRFFFAWLAAYPAVYWASLHFLSR